MLKGQKINTMKKKDKKSETGFDLLQTDGYDITSVRANEVKEPEFADYELDVADLDSTLSDLKVDDIEEFEEVKPVEVEVTKLPEEEEKEEPKKEEIPEVVPQKESRDINSMFEIATTGVLEAKNIFAKNVEMKEKIDAKFQELEDAKKEHERIKQSDIAKINSYKEAVTSKLKDKKAELDAQVLKLKEARSKYEQERTRFETYKKEEFERVKELKRQQRLEMEEKQKELDALTETLKQQKEEVEESKRQLELDRIKYEADKNELANNLLKFNDLVSDFTVNMDKLNN